MKKKNISNGILIFTIVALILYIIYCKPWEDKEGNIKSMLNSILKSTEDIPKEIQEDILELINLCEDIDEDFVKHLKDLPKLMEEKRLYKTIAQLAKIIENLLKKLYANDNEIKNNATLNELIEHAKKKGVINEKEFLKLNILRKERNEEAHDINMEEENSEHLFSIVCGIKISLKISKNLKSNLNVS